MGFPEAIFWVAFFFFLCVYIRGWPFVWQRVVYEEEEEEDGDESNTSN